jgi:citrate lyase subunit beta / citryl-CoA lyase
MNERSYLFVPGDSERKFAKAIEGDADGLILDLEDSVAANMKVSSRAIVNGMLAAGRARKQLWVRMNALDTEWAIGDLAAVVNARPFGIVAPKLSGGEDLRTVSNYLDAFETAAGVPLGTTKVMVIATEVGRAMFGLGTYANVTPRLWGISWGAEDLAADLGASANRVGHQLTEPYRLARNLCLYAAAAAGVRALDTVCVELDDLAVVRAESIEARRDGFVGKIAIHPKHITPINEAFTPSAEDVAWARKIVAAFEANPGVGAFRLEGKMIDRPHLRAARRTLGLDS